MALQKPLGTTDKHTLGEVDAATTRAGNTAVGKGLEDHGRSAPLGKAPRQTTTGSAASGSSASGDDPLSNCLAIVEKLLAVKGNKMQKQVLLKEDEIKFVLTEVREVFMSQPMLLEIKPPVRICGDTHGQYYDLLRIFDKCGFPPQSNYLFLGDYVDRGKHSVETIMLLFCYKILYRENFFLLRGNHECASINKLYGFYDDVKRRYNVKLFKYFAETFNTMPVCCCISDKILCMHGGLSPDMTEIKEINEIDRPCDVPDKGLLCDLLWSDPEDELTGFEDSNRGVGYLFGEDVVNDFLDMVDMDLIVRAHQVQERGYGFFASRQLVTIFSAPAYCGEFDNDAAVMNIDEKLQCSFQIIPAKELRR